MLHVLITVSNAFKMECLTGRKGLRLTLTTKSHGNRKIRPPENPNHRTDYDTN